MDLPEKAKRAPYITYITGNLTTLSVPQNGAAAYSQSHVSSICQGGFPLPSVSNKT